MKFKVSGEVYNLSDDDYLGEGREGVTYKVGDSVIKILDKCPKLHLGESDIIRLKDVKAHILDHPVDVAYSLNGDYIGPVSSYVSSSGYHNFSNLDSTKFSEIVDLLVLDSKIYANEHYMIADLQYADSIVDKDSNLHLVDSGSYSYHPSLSREEIERINKEEIDSYLVDEVIDYLLTKKNISSKKREIIKKEIKSQEDVSSYLKEEVSKYDDFDHYISSLKK